MKTMTWYPAVITLGCVLLSGCVSPPSGPNVTALPGTGKSYAQFQTDDSLCRDFARGNLSQATQQANNNVTANAAGGTLIGAASGALIGAASGQAGPGALIGAGAGLLVGSAVANNSSLRSNDDIQQQYNNVYVQCMYAKGNQVPMPAGYVAPPPAPSAVPPDYYPQPGDDVPPDYMP
ncbi:glycine zipper family protein [Pantoea sp. App145]|uniref:glycine zipper family protein n=1 Tax=Pantoea sp. App145 TaxID=3071567 RepID=UPI003A80A136